MRRNMFGAVCGVVAGVVALAGCTSDGTPPSASATSTARSSTSGTAATSSTPTPTRSMTAEEQDLRSAEAAITAYWKVIDEAASNPNQNLKILATVARAQALAQWQSTLSEYKAKQWKQVGFSAVRDAVATTKDGKSFTVRACLDVSGLDVVDGSGKSVVASNRPAQQRYTYTALKAPEGFFIVEDTLKGQPCDG